MDRGIVTKYVSEETIQVQILFLANCSSPAHKVLDYWTMTSELRVLYLGDLYWGFVTKYVSEETLQVQILFLANSSSPPTKVLDYWTLTTELRVLYLVTGVKQLRMFPAVLLDDLVQELVNIIILYHFAFADCQNNKKHCQNNKNHCQNNKKTLSKQQKTLSKQQKPLSKQQKNIVKTTKNIVEMT